MSLDWRGTVTGIHATWRREISAYFATPLAYVFVAIFLLVLGIFTWDLSRFFDTGAADLGSCRRSPCGFGRKRPIPARLNCCCRFRSICRAW